MQEYVSMTVSITNEFNIDNIVRSIHDFCEFDLEDHLKQWIQSMTVVGNTIEVSDDYHLYFYDYENLESDLGMYIARTHPECDFTINAQYFNDDDSLEKAFTQEYVQGVFFNLLKNGTKELIFCQENYEGSYEIERDVSQIKSNAFKGCSGLQKIKIPSSISKIPANAFNGCSSLLRIEIPKTVTAIAKSAFSKCHKLTIVGEAGSTAEKFAHKNNITFLLANAVASDKGIKKSEELYLTVKSSILPKRNFESYVDAIGRKSSNKLLTISAMRLAFSDTSCIDKNRQKVLEREIVIPEFDLKYNLKSLLSLDSEYSYSDIEMKPDAEDMDRLCAGLSNNVENACNLLYLLLAFASIDGSEHANVIEQIHDLFITEVEKCSDFKS